MSDAELRKDVQKLYVTHLKRPADPDGLEYFTNELKKDEGNIDKVLLGIIGSTEYFNLDEQKNDKERIEEIYEVLFNRPPDNEGLEYWLKYSSNRKKEDERIKDALDRKLEDAKIADEIARSAAFKDALMRDKTLEAAQIYTDVLQEFKKKEAELLKVLAEAERQKHYDDRVQLARDFLKDVRDTENDLTKVRQVAEAAITKLLNDYAPPKDPPPPPPPPTPFSASIDEAGVVSFTNAGTSVTVTWAADEFTFTSSGGTFGTATVPGLETAVKEIVVNGTTTLTIASALAANMTFTGTGAIALTDSTIAASTLNTLNTNTTGLLSAPDITEISGDLGDVKVAYADITEETHLTAPKLNTIKLTTGISAGDLDGVIFDKDMTIVVANATNTLTLKDSTVAAGTVLTIDGSGSTSVLTFDASAEANGKLIITGGTAADILTGGSGNDTLTGGDGADKLTGGAGHDTFAYTAANQSTRDAMDIIEDYSAGGAKDTIAVTGFTAVASNVKAIDPVASKDLYKALDDFATDNIIANGLYVFTLDGSTYVYVESAGEDEDKYVDSDFVLKINGTITYEDVASIFGISA